MAVVVDPVTKKMTHFVVNTKEMRPPPERMVPIELVVETTHERISLDCTRDEVAKMAPFVARRYIAKDSPDYSAYHGGEATTEWHTPYATTVSAPIAEVVKEELIPEGVQSMHRGARVDASDGHVGLVGELVIDEEEGRVTHIVLQEGHLFGKKEVTLPLSAIDRVVEDTVYLKLDKKAVEQLPAIPLKRSYVSGEADIELVIRVFDNIHKADEALEFVEGLRKQKAIKILNAAVLVKDEEGQVSINDTREIGAKKGRLMGAVTGGLVGLLAGPGGAVIGALAGLGVGGAAGKRIDEGFDDKFLENLQRHLQPGKSALVLLMEHIWVQKASQSMSDLGGMVFQQTITDTLVEDFLEGKEAE
jgi:uncharacterized membrane protein/sporulation protein YlmC with PRC-barrel domain